MKIKVFPSLSMDPVLWDVCLLLFILVFIYDSPQVLKSEAAILNTRSINKSDTVKHLLELEKQKYQMWEAANYGKDHFYTDLVVLQTTDSNSTFQIAKENGLSFIRKVFKDDDYYLFRHSISCKRCRRSARDVLKKIVRHPSVKWAAQQTSLHRVQRSEVKRFYHNDIHKKHLTARDKSPILKFLKTLRRKPLIFNDPLFEEQWYLHNRGQTGAPPENDINVLPVWKSGITGRGVRISVLDDGIHRQSAEVADNYDSVSSEEFSYINLEYTPVPENSHGTYCAAIAAGVANNKVCGVGVAYEAKVGGVRVLNGPITDVQEAMALVHALDHVDIYTASWGPVDDGKNMGAPEILTKMAFLKGISKGRQGKGAIYVWAAGNGGRYQDNCNLDGYASSPFTVTIGALAADGRSTYYSEPCAAVIASTYVGGSHIFPNAKQIQEERRKIKVVVPEGRGKCRETFQGTSAAAPMAAGVIALVLQANPNLSWRDIQHIIVETARLPALREDGWMINAAKKHIHLKVGFGILDAEKMVKAANEWQPVKPLHIWASPPYTSPKFILPKEEQSISLVVHKSAFQTLQRIDRLESVVATVNICHPRCGDLEIYLISPSGTISQVLTRRTYDNETTQLPYWDFLSLHFWGEDPEGRWTLNISNVGSDEMGTLDFFSLTLYGTSS
ncbi:proprotein convertase subtilisin/kexin type 6-like [Stegodyphus dumicola]|uniref:proprotein convertase subtilisin/kexin type 6-like n=1 Tax=Stegodyphus dumicola TaxID=202533 RepID=UPI0015B272FD|nr:proprotein convertase subtilisin/kexin type 6-like [Stegodyphus dumicola]